MKLKILFFLLGLIFSFELVEAQTMTLSGRLKDINTQKEISYATVFVKGTDFGATSDFGGKFTIKIPIPVTNYTLLIQHVSYEKTEISVSEFLKTGDIFLQPRVIPLKELEVVGDRTRSEIKNEIPQTISTLEATSFDLKGYTDIGDLLRVDHSVQVSEELSGKKTLSVRGGNPDEIIVMYNGVKLNSSYDNIFDLSLVDLENVDKLELVKGSTTSLYGSEAISGVLNIVPKIRQDYLVRFQQRIGSYGSGNWGLHLFKEYENVSASYSWGRGGQKRKYAAENKYLINESLNQSGSVNVELGELENRKVLGVLFTQVVQDYNNQSTNEKTKDANQLISTRYQGNIFSAYNFDLALSYKWLENKQKLLDNTNFLNKNIKDNLILFDFKKKFTVELIDFILAYQFEKGSLTFLEDQNSLGISDIGLLQGKFDRNRHAVVGIVKLHNETNSNFFQTFDVDFSLRRDMLTDKPNNIVYRSGGSGGLIVKSQNSTGNIYKISSHIAGASETVAMDIFANVGTNIKFPTLIQQISIPNNQQQPKILEPEKNSGLDVNFTLLKETRQLKNIDGLQLSLTYLKNEYENKIRAITYAGMPTPVYDNVISANMSGYEGKFTTFLFGKKLTTELGYSKYNISDLAAFPFKSDSKSTISATYDYLGYSTQILWFYESEQIGWVRMQLGGFKEYTLPANKNIDFHLSKHFMLSELKIMANFSVRNLLNDTTELEGLALRDRRFYLTFGAQF